MPKSSDLRVLLVDDQKAIRGLARFALEQNGIYKIDEAANGKEAMAYLRAGFYDLVISDWNMEPMDGIALLKAMRHDDNCRQIPFIMMTGKASKDDVQYAARIGVNNYVVKPFNAATLKSKIEQVVGAFE